MSSPAKRRKLDAGGKKASGQSKGLEYFFSKQRQGASSPSAQAAGASSGADQTDEELARKLQAQFDQEASRSTPNGNETPRESEGIQVGASNDKGGTPGSHQVDETKPSPKKDGTTLKLQSSGAAEDAVSSSIPLDESPLTFEPAKFLPQLQESWGSQGGDASYALLATCFTLVNGTQSRIKIVDTLVNCVRLLIEGNPSSLLPAVRLPFSWGSSLI